MFGVNDLELLLAEECVGRDVKVFYAPMWYSARVIFASSEKLSFVTVDECGVHLEKEGVIEFLNEGRIARIRA